MFHDKLRGVRIDAAEFDLRRHVDAMYDQLASEINHQFVYGEFACPVNQPIGNWRCIACGVLEVAGVVGPRG